MASDKAQTLPPPPGVIGSLRAGFDAIASNLAAILFPLLFDLLLWLGPRLHIDRLFDTQLKDLSQYTIQSGIPTTDVITIQETFNEILAWLQQYNLLSVLRTFPIGVFSLMSGKMPVTTPIGAPLVFHVQTIQTLFFYIGVLTLAGWLAGSLFFRWVASIVADSPLLQSSFGNDILQTIVLSTVWITLITIFGVPTIAMIGIVIAANPLIANGILLIGGLLSMWLIVPVFFTPHGIYLQQQNAFASIYSSFRMARFTLPTSSLFVVSVLLIAFGLNYLWNIPSSSSWMTLVGIAGHAFITTSLLAASFIYYRDMHAWLQTVLEKFRASMPAG
jgi:hypothetical protein